MPLQTSTIHEQDRLQSSIARCGLVHINHPDVIHTSIDRSRNSYPVELRGFVVEAAHLAALPAPSRTMLFDYIDAHHDTLIIYCSEDVVAYRDVTAAIYPGLVPGLRESLHQLPRVVVIGLSDYFIGSTAIINPLPDDATPELQALWIATALGDIDTLLSHQDSLDTTTSLEAWTLFSTAYYMGHLPLVQLLLPPSRFRGEISPYFPQNTDMNFNLNVFEFFLEWGISVRPHTQVTRVFQESAAAFHLNESFLPVMGCGMESAGRWGKRG